MNPPDNAASLVRQLGVFSATAIVVSNMVGTGIFTMTGYFASDLGSAQLILAIFAVGAVCALVGAFCYSELGVNFPSSGGEYVYLTQAFGPTWGFMTGWVSFIAGFSSAIALTSLAFADYLAFFWPALNQSNTLVSFGPSWFTIRVGGAQLCASALILLFTVINLFGIRTSASIQNVLTATKVIVIGGLLFFGFTTGTGDWAHFSQPATRGSAYPIAAQFAVSLFFVYVAYSGWNAATYVAEEIRQPAKTLPRALTYGTVLVAVLFLALNVLFIYSTPLEKMKGVIRVGSLAAENLFGTAVGGIFSALMAVSLMSTVNAMVTIGPRVYYAMAKNGAFFHSASYVHPRWHTPFYAILWQGVLSMLLSATPFIDLAFFIGFLLNFFATMAVSSILIFRKRPGWQKLPVVSFAYPLVPATFIVVGAWMTLFGLTLQPRVSAAAVVTVVAGALLYRSRIHSRPARTA